MFNFGGAPNSEGEDVFSQFGRSIHVSKDSPPFDQLNNQPHLYSNNFCGMFVVMWMWITCGTNDGT